MYLDLGFKYLTPTSEEIRVKTRLGFSTQMERIECRIEIAPARSRKKYYHQLGIGNRELEYRYEDIGSLINLFQDFAKDLILTGSWRSAREKGKQDQIETLSEGQMEALGFHEIGNGGNISLTYIRRVDAIAMEGGLSRRRILERMYSDPAVNIGKDELLDENRLCLPKEVLEKGVRDLEDLEYVEAVTWDANKKEGYRLRAKGKRFYEEYALPAFNEVFIIAPCKEKKIVDLYERIICDNGMKPVVQEKVFPKKETIREDMLTNIRSSKFVIADITGTGIQEGERYNANCVYELGYAHACGKRIICCVKKEITFKDKFGRPILPFDLANVYFAFWELHDLDQYEKEIREKVQQIRALFHREYWLEIK